MRFFKPKSPLALASGLMCVWMAMAAPVRAQESPTAPVGWAKSVAAGDAVYTDSESGCRILVRKLTPFASNLRTWFDTLVERDSKSRGKLLAPGRLTERNDQLYLGQNYRSAQGIQSVIYVGYAVGTRGRFLMYSGPGPKALSAHLSSFTAMTKNLIASDLSGSSRGVGTGSGGRRPQSGVRTRPVNSSTRGGVTTPRGTLKSSQILGIYLDASYTVGVGGMVLPVYNPVLFLRDGSVRRNLEVPPTDLALARDKALNARDWGRWKRSGAKFSVRWGDGKSDEVEANLKALPAQAGRTLAGGYRTVSGGGNTAMGGDIMVFSSRNYFFARDGRFALQKSGGGGSSAVTALSQSKTAGRYRLDGYALTLKFNDGRQVRRLFYYYPDDPKGHVVAIGGDGYVGDD